MSPATAGWQHDRMPTVTSALRRRSGAVAALLISCSALGATAAPPAGAAEPAAWSRTDPTGDAPPPADITSASTHWGPKGRAVFVRVNVVDLQPAGRLRVSMVTDGETFHLLVKKTPTSTKARVQNINFDSSQRVPCPGIKVNWNAADDFIFMDVPLGVCINSSPWGTDGVQLTGPAGAVDKVGQIVWSGD
jgi:hypothetical protein